MNSFYRLQPSAATPIGLSVVLRAAANSSTRSGKEDLESLLASRLGMKTGIAFSSLMRSTYAAVAAAKRLCKPEASIILPRYSCPSFIHGIQAAGMPYRYCDTDPGNLAVRCEDLRVADDGKVGAILIPNLFGLSADMMAIRTMCTERNWLLLEGADYTLGGSFAGRELGSYGHFSILNFQEGKALPIGGGMTLSQIPNSLDLFSTGPTANPVLAFVRSLAYSILIRPSCYGIFSALISKVGVAKKNFSMEDTIRKTASEYDFAVDSPRLSERLSRFQSSLGRQLLAGLDANLHVRNENAFALEAALQGITSVTLINRHPRQDRCHYIRYPILVGNGRRDELCKHLVRQGYEASPMYVEHGMRVDAKVHPGAARICAELLTLPCHPFMSEPEILRLAATTRSFMQ
ncbi:MAG: DegT/DnrJ/EryC1/StrS family aminotransferase [Bryobacterales bacterium]|nr:DegT/DnrJ/EryC1/StrS family aminotransferase [Bryobacterales bacterium]